MRIDKFLNTTNILKRRALAQDMCESGVVLLNGIPAKSAKEVKVGDEITLRYLEYEKKYLVLAIPTSKNVPKSQSSKYFQIL
ncbi:MAG: RNA-binding S4 domain-containing protein [Helicobacter sp.]|uniref:RNA-binding S4 domain-containing protein n=1 Tax=Helicobacter sp. 10-6591 TaxID=2004998 RepID=UPI000DCF02BF|nr:RNA-binding S4 domain-containing protein [Helicobacter sp. 10-6591]MCI6217584.1 RNA-binding S4 domain-containing protein [Helicobacter sp.]MDD7567919.1 RNA-binding S4 domain-containing protein [Helicobacter sp.]MDY5740049.1 RNA-binding S4 domain-containing protein [Helicobacter sp.]RAX55416.1 hypothetical protein CCY97_04520 [Helicobacter sp. 10-6591]